MLIKVHYEQNTVTATVIEFSNILYSIGPKNVKKIIKDTERIPTNDLRTLPHCATLLDNIFFSFLEGA